jgi:hypothetical protein
METINNNRITAMETMLLIKFLEEKQEVRSNNFKFNKSLTNTELNKSEQAIENLADALHITELQVLEILTNGIGLNKDMDKEDIFDKFISEMEATFGML